MLIQALRMGNPIYLVAALLASAFLVFVVLPIHEWAHAITAYKCGDDTPKLAGGLTLNPMAHIDPMGAVLIVLTGFGWGKPTPTNPNNYRHPRRDSVLVAFAGPLSNLLMGWLLIFIGAVILQFGGLSNYFLQLLAYFFCYAGEISTYLAVVNLLPIPQFDGFAILEGILPQRAQYWIQRNYRTITIVVLLLFLFGIFSYPLMYLSNYLCQAFWWLSNLPFGGATVTPGLW